MTGPLVHSTESVSSNKASARAVRQSQNACRKTVIMHTDHAALGVDLLP
jgi:hypothetical protein